MPPDSFHDPGFAPHHAEERPNFHQMFLQLVQHDTKFGSVPSSTTSPAAHPEEQLQRRYFLQAMLQPITGCALDVSVPAVGMGTSGAQVVQPPPLPPPPSSWCNGRNLQTFMTTMGLAPSNALAEGAWSPASFTAPSPSQATPTHGASVGATTPAVSNSPNDGARMRLMEEYPPVGSTVEVKFGDGVWYRGQVSFTNREHANCTINFDDGSTETHSVLGKSRVAWRYTL